MPFLCYFIVLAFCLVHHVTYTGAIGGLDSEMITSASQQNLKDDIRTTLALLKIVGYFRDQNEASTNYAFRPRELSSLSGSADPQLYPPVFDPTMSAEDSLEDRAEDRDTIDSSSMVHLSSYASQPLSLSASKSLSSSSLSSSSLPLSLTLQSLLDEYGRTKTNKKRMVAQKRTRPCYWNVISCYGK